VVPGRPLDSFGIGWARTEFSDSFVPFLRQQLRLGLEREDAVEMYYNASITRALTASLDLQVIDPALKKTLDASARNLRDVNTAVVAAGALHISVGFCFMAVFFCRFACVHFTFSMSLGFQVLSKKACFGP
jgi:porin